MWMGILVIFLDSHSSMVRPRYQTTVRYDEITPRFILGRLIIIPLRVFGLLLIALPSFVLQRKFSIVREMMDGNHDKGVPLRNEETNFTRARPQRTSPANDANTDLKSHIASP